MSECVKMPMDGHCVFSALGYFVDKSAMELRKILYDACTEDERAGMHYLLVTDGSRDGWGSTDCLRVFRRVFGICVCVHLDMNGDKVVTRAYKEKA